MKTPQGNGRNCSDYQNNKENINGHRNDWVQKQKHKEVDLSELRKAIEESLEKTEDADDDNADDGNVEKEISDEKSGGENNQNSKPEDTSKKGFINPGQKIKF